MGGGGGKGKGEGGGGSWEGGGGSGEGGGVGGWSSDRFLQLFVVYRRGAAPQGNVVLAASYVHRAQDVRDTWRTASATRPDIGIARDADVCAC